MLQELSAQVNGGIEYDRVSDCPDESVYWSFWDEEDSPRAIKDHFTTCQYCKAELVRVGMAILLAPEPELLVSPSRIHKSLKQAMPEAKVILQSIKGNIAQIFNLLQVLPVYRSTRQHALVLSAGDQSAQVEIEVMTDSLDQYSLYVAVKTCRYRDGIVVTIERNGDLLRSVSLRSGDRTPIGTWEKGVYLLCLSSHENKFYKIEFDLR